MNWANLANFIWIVTFVIAIALLVYKHRLPTEKQESFESKLVVLILVFLVGAVIRIIYSNWQVESAIPNLTSKLESALPIVKSNTDNKAIMDLNSARNLFADRGNSAMAEVLNEYVSKHNKFLDSTVRTKVVKAEPGEEIWIASKLLQSARASVDATSYVQPDFWWRSDEGKEYFEFNRQMIEENGIRIRRIFILPPDSNELSMKDLLDCNSLAGVETFVALEKDIKSRRREDVIIIDGTAVAGRLDLDRELRTRHSEFSSGKTFVNNQIESFEEVLKVAKQYSTISSVCEFSKEPK